jgi:hypothetical protein
MTLNINGIGGASFSEQFSAADLTTSTPVPGTSATLLSGSKTATDGSVRTLTILDTASSNFNYTVLGAGYAPNAGATSTNAAVRVRSGKADRHTAHRHLPTMG